MLKHDLFKDGANPNSKMRSSPLKPLFMLINMMAGLLAICVFRQAEQFFDCHWLIAKTMGREKSMAVGILLAG